MASNQRKTVKIEKIGAERKIRDGKTTEQDVIEVSVYYSKGGLNYFHGGSDPRGYYLSVTPKTIEVTEGSPFRCERTMLMSGFKKFVREAARFSDKALNEVAAQAAESRELVEAMKAKILASEQGVTA
jgi:hypothetical protein